MPAITLQQYFQRIQKYCPTTNDVFLSLLVYFDRIAKTCNHGKEQLFVMDSYNIHRLIISAVTVSTKFFSDFFYSNSRYARVGGISLKELNHLEPVSYTHLDVYKRQKLVFIEGSITVQLVVGLYNFIQQCSKH